MLKSISLLNVLLILASGAWASSLASQEDPIDEFRRLTGEVNQLMDVARTNPTLTPEFIDLLKGLDVERLIELTFLLPDEVIQKTWTERTQ